VDAMAAADGKVWLLEMNCSLTVHPDAYAGIFERLSVRPRSDRFSYPLRKRQVLPSSA
jgi:hypothetical protein